jgi:hypothetical protein
MSPLAALPLDGGKFVTSYDTWKTTEPDPYAHEPVGECHWCHHHAVLYRTWLHPKGVIEVWLCDDCLEEAQFSFCAMRST